MTFQELFIINLKDFRKINNFSQAKLAELCEFPSPDMIERIASALDVESYCLFQNKAVAENKSLTPLQRQEIVDRIYSATQKIVNQY